jgi:hypothetical protein
MWTVIDSTSGGLTLTMFSTRTVIDNFNHTVIDNLGAGFAKGWAGTRSSELNNAIHQD